MLTVSTSMCGGGGRGEGSLTSNFDLYGPRERTGEVLG